MQRRRLRQADACRQRRRSESAPIAKDKLPWSSQKSATQHAQENAIYAWWSRLRPPRHHVLHRFKITIQSRRKKSRVSCLGDRHFLVWVTRLNREIWRIIICQCPAGQIVVHEYNASWANQTNAFHQGSVKVAALCEASQARPSPSRPQVRSLGASLV